MEELQRRAAAVYLTSLRGGGVKHREDAGCFRRDGKREEKEERKEGGGRRWESREGGRL